MLVLTVALVSVLTVYQLPKLVAYLSVGPRR
jgi:hypothetical protein